MKLTIVAGARPNFMKIAPIIHALKAHPEARKRVDYRLVHTGQHYDHQMSQTFFEELNIPAPDRNLGVGSGTQAEQTARIMVTFEKELIPNHAIESRLNAIFARKRLIFSMFIMYYIRKDRTF